MQEGMDSQGHIAIDTPFHLDYLEWERGDKHRGVLCCWGDRKPKGNGVIGLDDMVVGAVNAYFSGNVNTARALNGCCIEAVVNFTQLGGHHMLATGQEHRHPYPCRQRGGSGGCVVDAGGHVDAGRGAVVVVATSSM